MTRDLTILIPTAGRPDTLRTALESVHRQTGRARIAQVIVSENLGDPRSREVCSRFPDLPIQHVMREPRLSTLQHAHTLFSHDHGTAYTAVLHDDDWWRPGHLERALGALDRQPEAAVSYGGYWCVIGEQSSVVGQQDNGLFWAVTGRPLIDTTTWTLTHPQVLLATLGGALGHYSSLVARATALRAAAPIYQLDNPMDNDRHLTAELSRHGLLLYHPQPELFVRQHAAQDIKRFDDAAHRRWMTGTTNRILALARQGGLDVRAALETLFANHPAELQPYLLAYYTAPWCHGPLVAAGLAPERLRQDPRAHPSPLRWREWIPPALATMARRWRNRG